MEIFSLNTLSKRFGRQPAEIETVLAAQNITATGTYGPITYYGVEAVKALESADDAPVTMATTDVAEAAAVSGSTIIGVPNDSAEIRS